MMTRRGFLRGTLAAGAAAGTAILSVTPEEMAAFGKPLSGPISLMQPDPVPAEAFRPMVESGEFVYNSKGHIIGVVSDISMERQALDVTGHGDTRPRYISGRLEVSYTVIGTGFATAKAWTGTGFFDENSA